MLAVVSVLAIGMGWPTAPWTGQPWPDGQDRWASLTLEPYHLNGDYHGLGTIGAFGLGWLATGTATAVLTPVATDTATVRTPSPDTSARTRPASSEQGSPAAGQAVPTAETSPLAPAAQPTTAETGAAAPGQPTLAAPTGALAGPQALPTATLGAGSSGSPGQAESAPVATAAQPAEALSVPAQSVASSTRSTQPPPALPTIHPAQTFALGLILIGLGVAYLFWKHRTPL
jgi:hypothetical protein